MEIIYFLDAQAGSQVEQPAPGPGGLWTQFDATLLERRLIRQLFKKPNRITAPRRAGEGECPNAPFHRAGCDFLNPFASRTAFKFAWIQEVKDFFE
jgi:hypothetical protein